MSVAETFEEYIQFQNGLNEPFWVLIMIKMMNDNSVLYRYVAENGFNIF
jgi:hypothetical protein